MEIIHTHGSSAAAGVVEIRIGSILVSQVGCIALMNNAEAGQQAGVQIMFLEVKKINKTLSWPKRGCLENASLAS